MESMKKIWEKLSSLSLSIWLLMSSSLMMLISTHLAEGKPRLYMRLNTTPIWLWLKEVFVNDPLVFVSTVLLLISLALLGLNTLACTTRRIAELAAGKKTGGSGTRRFVNWAPTLMHTLFFLVLAGHMTTFTFGRWKVHTIRQGELLRFSEQHQPLRVKSFSRLVRNVEGALTGSTIGHRVVTQIGGRELTIGELNPARLPNGDWLLFLPSGTREGKRSAGSENPVDCSLEERQIGHVPFDSHGTIQLKQVSDPGLYFLFTGLGLIILLMAFHYILSWKSRR